ncbi:MAG: hypothetical protein PWP23_1872 [Candidatus Sumerlaeota bacterium]|nr:hypothetical protein [Candidatus Sumerlaeota bacterium]
MISLRATLLALFVLLLSVAFAQEDTADEPLAQVALNFEKAEIGAKGTLTLQLPDGMNAKSVSVSIPAGQDVVFLPDPEEDPALNADGTWSIPVRLLLKGEHEIEKLDVTATFADGETKKLVAGSVQATIDPPATERAQPRDYTPAFKLPPNWGRIALFAILALVVAGLVLGALVFAIVRLLKRKSQQAAAPARVVTPLEEARVALEQLAALDFYRTHGSKAHYLALSELLRRYFERTCGVPALEMTEDEVREFVRRRFLERPAALALIPVLDVCDLAKFARMEVAEEGVKRDLAAAAAFLDAEDERLRLAAARQASTEAAA